MNAEVSESNQAKQKRSAPAVETVEMEDGRKVDFVGKRKMLKESIFDDQSHVNHIRIDFRNGRVVKFNLPSELFHRFAAHGAEQKLGDEVAGTEDVDDMVLEIEDLVGRLRKGEWNVRREAGGMAGTSVLLKAMVEFAQGRKTVEQVKEYLSTKTQAEKLALRNSPKLKPIVERLEAEKVAKGAKVDTDALLAGFEA
ncbi:MAG: hypothetical protein ACREBW_01935 [Candidatus Micrarchaeaceae archaeon]